MKTFTYIIKDKAGMHARPAGLFSKKASEFQSEVTVSLGEKSANALRIFSLMGLEAKCGSEITVTISGADEDNAAIVLEDFLKNNL